MLVKNYDLYKTGEKTKRVNKLMDMKYEVKTYLDLSLLDDPAIDISEEEKDHIKRHIAETHIVWERQDIFIILYDNFTDFTVKAQFANHNVFNKKTYSKLYRICELTRVQVIKGTRKDVYQQMYDNVTYEANNHHSEPAMDIEI